MTYYYTGVPEPLHTLEVQRTFTPKPKPTSLKERLTAICKGTERFSFSITNREGVTSINILYLGEPLDTLNVKDDVPDDVIVEEFLQQLSAYRKLERFLEQDESNMRHRDERTETRQGLGNRSQGFVGGWSVPIQRSPITARDPAF